MYHYVQVTYLLWFGDGSMAGMFTMSCSTYLSGRGGDWGTFFNDPPNAACPKNAVVVVEVVDVVWPAVEAVCGVGRSVVI